MRTLTRYFLEGLLFLVPVVVTVYTFYFLLTKIDKLFDFQTPGLGLLSTVGLIMLFGFIASNFVTKRLLGYMDFILRKLPIVKMVYTSVRDLTSMFVGDKGFTKPVAVTLIPGSEVEALGFITQESMESLGIANKVAVYLPKSYTFAGLLVLVPRSQIRSIEADSMELMAFIVSGGLYQTKFEA